MGYKVTYMLAVKKVFNTVFQVNNFQFW